MPDKPPVPVQRTTLRRLTPTLPLLPNGEPSPEAYADLPGQDGVEASMEYFRSADKRVNGK